MATSDEGLLFTDTRPATEVPPGGQPPVSPQPDDAPQLYASPMPGATAVTDPETLELRRTLRILRRYWLTIACSCLLLGGGIYVYDVLLYDLLGSMGLKVRIGARKTYRLRLTCELNPYPDDPGHRRLGRPRLDPDSMRRLPSRPEFARRLEALMRSQRAGAPGRQCPRVEFALVNGTIVTASVTGRDRRLLPLIANNLVPTLNAYYRDLRARRIDEEKADLCKMIAGNEKALDDCWSRLNRVNTRMHAAGDGTAQQNAELDALEKERHKLTLKDEKLHIHLDYYKQKHDYQLLAQRFYVRSPEDVAKLTVEGNVLRSEWARLELELTRLRMRYTEQHPRIVALRNDIDAVKRRLLQTGGATSMGRLPPIPRPADLEVFKQVAAMEDEIAINRTELLLLERKLDTLRRRLARTQATGSDQPDVQKLEREHDDLAAEIASLRKKRLEAISRRAELDLKRDRLREHKEFSLVNPPGRLELVSPRVWLDLAMGLMFGLVLGSAMAFLRGSLDNYLHTPNDVFYHLKLNYLGVIPLWKERQIKLIDPAHPLSGIADVYAHLCNNIRFGRGDTPEKCLLVASALPGEGKSTICVNLAIRYAMEGNSVVLVDADMRRRRAALPFTRPRAGAEDASEEQPGLAAFLEGEAELEQALQDTEISGLHLLPSGKLARNPTRLLRNRRMHELLRELQERFDVVILDCPAVLPVVDSTIIAPAVRGVLMVIAANEADIGSVRMALHRLRHVGAPLVGAAMNKVRDRSASSDYYGYGYRYGYGENATAEM